MTSQINKEDLSILYQDLNNGVETNETSTIGVLSVFGSTAFPILAGNYTDAGATSRQVVGACSRFGEGKIVGFSHDLFVHPDKPTQFKLLENCVTWTAGNEKGTEIRVGILENNDWLRKWKPASNIIPSSVSIRDLTKDILESYDVIILVNFSELSYQSIILLKKWIRSGGGLVTAATGWAFKEDDMIFYKPNMICTEAGFIWTKTYPIKPVVPNSTYFTTDPEHLNDTHAGLAWKLMKATTTIQLKTVRMVQLNEIVRVAKTYLPSNHLFRLAVERGEPVQNNTHDLAIILQELEKSGVEKTGTVGPVAVYGPNAFTILAGKFSQDDKRHPVGGGARFGNGKVAAFGHDSFSQPSASKSQIQLLTNSVIWAASDEARKKELIRVGVCDKNQYTKQWIQENENRFDLKVFYDSREIVDNLSNIDVLLLANINRLQDPVHIEKVRDFVKHGGGLITSGTGWAREGDIKKDFHGSKLLQGTGLAWTDVSSLETIEANSSSYSTKLENLTDTNAWDAWDLFYAHMSNEINLSSTQLAQLGSVIDIALGAAIDTGPGSLLKKVSQALSENDDDIIPSTIHNVVDPAEKIRLKFKIKYVYNSDDDIEGLSCRCYPATQYFPGLPSPDAEKLENYNVTFTGTEKAWYSTGLYALAGEEVLIKFSKPVDQDISFQIGCHSDDITKIDYWSRCPQLTVRKKVTKGTAELKIHNTFGGLLYFVNNVKKAVELNASVSGVILAPYFVLGKTSLEDWKTIRKYGAPWGELETNKIILTLPGPKLATLDDPIELMKFWDRVMDADADLAAIPRDRPYPERIVADVQISAGYMHAGYPIMIQTDVSVDTALSIPRLKTTDAWGHYHEIGHNHQVSSWTFEGTGEVTNNVFALHVFDTVCGTRFEDARPDKLEKDAMKKAIQAYEEGGVDYTKWGDDPFLGLLFYVQLQKRYGWDAFKKVFKAYQTLKPLPNTQQQKLDAWLVQFSKAVGENLGPLFKAWGIPFTDSALKEVETLPATKETLYSMVK